MIANMNSGHHSKDKFKDFRSRPADGAFEPRGNRGSGFSSQQQFSEEYYDFRRNEREKIGIVGVSEVWSRSPQRLHWPHAVAEDFAPKVKLKKRKGKERISGSDTETSGSEKDRKKLKKAKKRSEKKKKVATIVVVLKLE